MKCTVLHEVPGRIRVHLCCGRMSLRQADLLECYFRTLDGVSACKVFDRTQDAVVVYHTSHENIVRALSQFSFQKAEAAVTVPEHTTRALNREFEDKLTATVINRSLCKLFLPSPLSAALAIFRSVKSAR